MCVCLYIHSGKSFRDFLKIALCQSILRLEEGEGKKVAKVSNFATFRNLSRLGDNMVNFRKYLQESKDRKFSALASKRQTEPNPYSCNYSPVSGHKYCEHAHCILDATWLRNDAETTKLRNKLQEEKDYLKNGEGTYGYDKVKVYKNVLKLRKLLGERR